MERTGQGSATRKLLKLSDTPKRAVDVVGVLPTVAFSPEDLDLIIGAPSIRRRFLDVVLSQVDREYMRHLSRYNRMVSHRNSLLKSLAGGTGSRRGELDFWDDQVIALGAYVIAARASASAEIGRLAGSYFADLAAFVADLTVHYVSPLDQPPSWWESTQVGQLDIRSAAQRVAVAFEAALRAALPDDLARGATTVGPHRDDLEILIDARPLQRFGSRGQQRLAIIALKLAEIEYMSSRLEAKPVLMLDDVMSELDRDHQRLMLARAKSSGCQLFVTATDRDLVTYPELCDLRLAVLDSPGQLRFER